MEPNIWWHPNVPSEVKGASEDILAENLFLLPTWVHELIVAYDGDDGNAAYISSQPEYRNARLTLTGWFLRQDAIERVNLIRHEFIHCPLCPLTDWTKDLIKRLVVDDNRLRDWLHKEWQEMLEAAVCDLELALRLSPGSSPEGRVPTKPRSETLPTAHASDPRRSLGYPH